MLLFSLYLLLVVVALVLITTPFHLLRSTPRWESLNPQNNETAFNKVKNIASARIEYNNFNIDAKQSHELAFKGMIAASLNKKLNNANYSEMR